MGCIRSVLHAGRITVKDPTMNDQDLWVGCILNLLNSIAIHAETQSLSCKQPKRMIYTEEISLFNDKRSKIREELAVQFFKLSFEVSASSDYNKNIVAVLQFLALCNSKEQEVKQQLTEILGKSGHEVKYKSKNSNSIVLYALEASLSKQPFIHFLSENCQAIFLKGDYRGFRCSPLIICRAIITAKCFYKAGSERSADKLIWIIIKSFHDREFKLSNSDASDLYEIAAQVQIANNDYRSVHKILMCSIAANKNNYKAITLFLTTYLRDFRFDRCYYLLYRMTILNRDQNFKAISLFIAACVDYTRPEREEFILTMHEDQMIMKEDQKGQKIYRVKYYRFGECCAYFMYLSLDSQAAHYQFKKWYHICKDIVSIEGMYLCSYRLKDYERALKEFHQMKKMMPYESGWKLTIAAVCYFKLGDEKKATARLAEVDKVSLTFEEDVFFCGVLMMLGQQGKAIKRLSALPPQANSILNTQKAIVMLLCEQKQGKTAYVNRILESLPYLEQNELSIDHRYMEFQQSSFLANFFFRLNRLAEGRHYVKKIRRMDQPLKKIATKKAFQRLMEEFNKQRQVEIELIFR